MTLTFYIALAAMIYVITGTTIFGSRKSGYSHLKNTISELGEAESKDQNKVNYGFFLPVGLLLALTAAMHSDSTASGLALVLGIGYLIAAFFPCDVGSPISGSWKQQIHNLGGFIQYVGSIYFLNESNIDFLLPNQAVSIILIVALVLISIPGLPLRGLVQRLTEFILFGSLVKLSYL